MKNRRTAQTLHFLKWIRRHSGLWYLLCTPGDEHMNLNMMRQLIGQLYQEGFYEMIFVLLMVHRDNPALSHVSEYLLLDSFIARWSQEKENIMQEIKILLE